MNVRLSGDSNYGTQVPELFETGDGQESDMIQRKQFDFPKGKNVAFTKG